MSLNTPDELQRKLDALTNRISAIDTDLLRETDHERQMLLQQKRDDMAREREEVAAEIGMLSASARAQEGGSLDRRVSALERQMRRVLRVVNPAPMVILLVILAGSLGCGVWSSFLVLQVREYYRENPVVAVLISFLAAALCVALLSLAWFMIHDEDGRDGR